ncbi:hypothetical protein [Vagococcus sp. WN89Y]|uniref:hypothetical protein n=1 Tax=Vagococcus sp. WN89Y TaxID=3457258 RepID=UPI003FCD4B5E
MIEQQREMSLFFHDQPFGSGVKIAVKGLVFRRAGRFISSPFHATKYVEFSK